MKSADNRSVGISELERRHQRLFERFVLVKETMAKGRGWDAMHSALATLIDCFKSCFAMEEALMRIHDCAERKGHEQEHADLLQMIHAMEVANLSTGLTEQMIGMAFAATMKHHLTQDRSYARCLPPVQPTATGSANPDHAPVGNRCSCFKTVRPPAG